MSRRSGVPLVRLTILALVPALAIAGVWQFADANVPLPTTTTTTTIPPEPVDELATDLLSLRRHPTPLAERAAEDDAEAVFVGRVAALGDEIGDAVVPPHRRRRRCRGRVRCRDRRDSGQQREALRRRDRARVCSEPTTDSGPS